MSTKELVAFLLVGFLAFVILTEVFFSPVTSALSDIQKAMDRLCEAIESSKNGGKE